MRLRRLHCGSEAVEVGVTSLVLLTLSIGVMTMFGDQIGQFFQGKGSPIIVSAKMGKTTLANGETSTNSDRTNIGKNLATGDNNTLLNLESAKSDTVETSGASGDKLKTLTKDQLEKQVAYFENYDVESGDDVLDSAIGAKKAAISVYKKADTANNQASILDKKSKALVVKSKEQEAYLAEIKKATESIDSEITKVVDHLELLKAMKEASSYNTNYLNSYINKINGVNVGIQTQSNLNYIGGEALLTLNQQAAAFQSQVETMTSSYYNNGVTECDEFGFNCYFKSTSGYTADQIGAVEAQAVIKAEQVEAQSAQLSDNIEYTEGQYESFQKNGEDAKKKADELKAKAKDTLITAFNDDTELFKNSNSVEELIQKAIESLGNGKAKVKDKGLAWDAIKLLKSASTTYNEADYYLSKAQAMKNNLNQQQEIYEQLQADSAALSLTIQKYSTDDMNAAKKKQEAAITYANNPIAFMTIQQSQLSDTKVKAVAQQKAQEGILEALKTSSKKIGDDAATALTNALKLKDEAQKSIDSAQTLISNYINTLK